MATIRTQRRRACLAGFEPLNAAAERSPILGAASEHVGRDDAALAHRVGFGHELDGHSRREEVEHLH